MGRFLYMGLYPEDGQTVSPTKTSDGEKKVIKELLKEVKANAKTYKKYMEKDMFGKAFDMSYHFIWHRFADYYIESLKEGIKSGNKELLESLLSVYKDYLVMLHPFIPFVTEAVWQVFEGDDSTILNTDVLKK